MTISYLLGVPDLVEVLVPDLVASGVAEVVASGVGLMVGVAETVGLGVGVGAAGICLPLSQTKYAAKSTIIKMITTMVTLRLKIISPPPVWAV